MTPQPLDNDLVAGDLKPGEQDAVSILHGWIAALFSEKLNIEVASVDTDLMETGAMDSLAFVELLLHLEEKFKVKIPLENLELDNFRSITCIAKFIAGSNEYGPHNGNGHHHNGTGDPSRPALV
jgi:acyl carrier protein